MSRTGDARRADRLQAGIFFRSGERPPPYWRLVLLGVAPGAGARESRDAIGALMRLLAGLRAGRVRELRGQPADAVEATRRTFEELAVLIGYGRSLFDPDRHDPPLTGAERPEFLAYLASRGPAFPALPWAEPRGPSGEADLALQLTGPTAATVNLAAVEVWKLIEDEGLPLSVLGGFDGFGRPDGRGWLEFHDGIGNMESSRRLDALAARTDPSWMAGGTYMAFLRMRVDLRVWRALPRGDQELVVGRDKLTGTPLAGVRRDSSGRAHPSATAPQPGRPAASRLAERADPAQAADPLLAASHVHRANQNRASPGAPAGLRIFRQGYDFLASIGPGGPELGLNFVSFQSDLASFQHLMHLPGWLADVNFGGPAAPAPGDPPSPALAALLSGGLYAVPPRARPFAGAGLFDAR